MNLTKLASKPQLTKVIIDDEETIKEVGETVEFYVYDRQDITTFMKLATIDQNNFGAIAETVKEMVLDEKGKQVLVNGNSLPMNLMLKVVEKVINTLGNSVSQTTAV